MAKFELKLPKMGESVAEATITSWLKEVGDFIEQDEAVVEIATDKVDSEIPSEVDGTLVKILFNPDDVIEVGQTIAIIETNEEKNEEDKIAEAAVLEETPTPESSKTNTLETKSVEKIISTSGKFYSPLVKTIAKAENVSIDELETITGSGKDQRVTKNDILKFIEDRKIQSVKETISSTSQKQIPQINTAATSSVSVNGNDEIIEMSRMGKLIAQHMVNSKHTSAHVQSFIEVDVTNIVNWRNKVKDKFLAREGEKLTFTPIFMEAIVKAIKDFPLINISLRDNNIIKHKDINLGMATALPDGNLIVPVIKNADQINLVGMAKAVNTLALKARTNQLKPDDIQNGTYTVTNVGSFGSVFGTPIINQPQVAILALGSIRKVPAVIETPEGDFIGIRHKMFLSHSYDHRIVNGALGGMFIKRVAEYLENFDVTLTF